MLNLARAHGAEVDFRSIFLSVPIDEQGLEVNLEPFAATAKPLAEQLLAFLEHREKELKELQAQERASEAAQ